MKIKSIIVIIISIIIIIMTLVVMFAGAAAGPQPRVGGLPLGPYRAVSSIIIIIICNIKY